MRIVSRKVAAFSLIGFLVMLLCIGETIKVFFSPHGVEKISAAMQGGIYLDQSRIVRQRRRNECAVACMAMLLNMRDQEQQYDILLNLTHLNAEGASMAEMMRVLDSFRVPTKYIRIQANDLDRMSLPAIAFVHRDHFVVVTDVDQSWVTVEDPAIGRVRFFRPFFLLSWGGDLLVANPQTSMSANQGGFKSYDLRTR